MSSLTVSKLTSVLDICSFLNFLWRIHIYSLRLRYCVVFVSLRSKASRIQLISKWAPFWYFFLCVIANCKLARSRLNILLNFSFKSEANRANLQGISKWRPFWNYVYNTRTKVSLKNQFNYLWVHA